MGYFNNGIGAARINDSSPSDYTTYSSNKIETKQDSTDNTLTTTSKTIVGAINEVNSKVNNKFIVAQTLPVSDIDEFAIYLIPKSTVQANNIYDEYIYISTDTPAHWEKIGDTEIDLSGYYTSSQVDTLLSNKQDATDNSLSTTDKTVVGAINELKSGKQDAFTMKVLTASDVFANTTNIVDFYGYQIGKIVFISRLVVKGGTVVSGEIRYANFKSDYYPISPIRFLWDKGGSAVMVKGVWDTSNGLVIFDTDNTQQNYAYSFSFLTA